jgi:glycine C-acetyltransferase/8-amino-7-oxononanoate synthase
VALLPRAVHDSVVQCSRLFSGNTPLPLPLLVGGMRAMELFSSSPGFLGRLRANAEHVKKVLRGLGLDLPMHPGPIVSVVPEAAPEAGRLRRKLLAAGIYPPLIRYPGGAEGGYFRFAISSEHSRQQLNRLIEVLGNELGSESRSGRMG